MSVLGGLAGSGAGAVTIALALLLARHQYRIPWAGVWLARLATVLMFAGGSALAVTTLGQWAITAATGAAGVLGGLQTGLAHAVIIIVALFLTAGVVADMAWAPGNGMITAAVLPLLLGLVPGGFLHGMFTTLAVPAGQYAATIAAMIGG